MAYQPKPKFRAHATIGNGAIPSGVATLVTFDTIDYDSHSCFTSNRFTPKVAGNYAVMGAIMWNTIAGTVTWRVSIFKNGAEVSRWDDGQSLINGGTFTQAIEDNIPMNGTTDYLEIYAFHNSGTDRALAAASALTYFTAKLTD